MRRGSEIKAQAILACLFRERQASRAQLAEALGIRKGTVGALCAALVADHTLEAADQGRQRNVRLQLNADRFVGVGMDHHSAGLHITALNARGEPILDEAFPLAPASVGGDRLCRIAERTRSLFRREGLKGRVVGIGFSDVGMIDPRRGVAVRAARLPGWTEMPVQAALVKAASRPVVLLTKVEAACLADGIGRGESGKETRLHVTLDRGVGAGVVRGGAVWRGDSEVCGELGHVCLAPDGDICACGNRGCLETVAGSEAIVRKIQAHAAPGDALEFGFDRQTLTLDQVIELAARGYGLAQLAIREAAEAVGRALAPILMVLGIRRVVCVGSLVKAGDGLLKPLEAALRQRCLGPLNRQLEVWAYAGEANVYARGAAFAALRQHFQCPGSRRTPGAPAVKDL